MSALDRATRRMAHHFGPGESLVSAVLGVEHREDGRPGRRRVVAVATEDRVLLATLRPERPVSLPYRDIMSAQINRNRHGAYLTIATRDGSHRIDRIKDEGALELLVGMIRRRIGITRRPASRAARVRTIDLRENGPVSSVSYTA